MKCVNCGTENPDGAKFCIKCGASLAAPAPAAEPPAPATPAAATSTAPPAPPAQAPAPTHAPEAAYAPPGAGGPAGAAGGQTPAFGTPPLAYTPPTAGVPPTGVVTGGPGPGAPMPPGYGMPVAKKHTKLYTGSLLMMLSGIIVVVMSWLPWAGSFGVNITGWDIFNGAENFGQRFVQIVDGKATFTALPMIIAGGLIVLLALLMILFRQKVLGVITLILSLGALGMSVVTMISLKTLGSGGISFGLSLQYGIYILGAFALVALIGSILSLAD